MTTERTFRRVALNVATLIPAVYRENNGIENLLLREQRSAPESHAALFKRLNKVVKKTLAQAGIFEDDKLQEEWQVMLIAELTGRTFEDVLIDQGDTTLKTLKRMRDNQAVADPESGSWYGELREEGSV